jgi:hypothetical protein
MESDIITTASDEAIVLFELSTSGNSGRSLHPVHPQELATKSAQALGQAMGTIQALANRTTEALAKLPHPPAETELEFGIKVDSQMGVLVSNSATDGNLRVKLTWKASSASPCDTP